jgi:biotin operon repressor
MSRKTSAEVDWLEVERLRERAFHGSELDAHQLDLCRAAVKADLKRYRQIGDDVRDRYARSVRGGA